MQSAIARGLRLIEQPLDLLSYRLKRKFHLIGPVSIVAYRGFGNRSEATIRGRVLEQRGLSKPDKDDPLLRNIAVMLRRFRGDEIPFTTVRASFREQVQTAATDEGGYFEFRFRTDDIPETAGIWHEVDLELVDEKLTRGNPVRSLANIMIPGSNSRFGIISDIDDTILVSHATSLMRYLQVMFVNNARTRKPFEGISAFYSALQKGADLDSWNPIFYVSNSPWNLYDLLVRFCVVNDIPDGPFFLQDFGLTRNRLLVPDRRTHKLMNIRWILGTYTDLPFILIGDNGQKDPEVYLQISREFPGRIASIYIRNITSRAPDRKTDRIRDDLSEQGLDMVLAKDTVQAAEHAVNRGFINEHALPLIRGEKIRDEEIPGPFRQMLRKNRAPEKEGDRQNERGNEERPDTADR